MPINHISLNKNDRRIYKRIKSIMDSLLYSVPDEKKDEVRTLMLVKVVNMWQHDLALMYVVLRNVKYSVLRKKEVDSDIVETELINEMLFSSEDHRGNVNEMLTCLLIALKRMPVRHQEVITFIIRKMKDCNSEFDKVKIYKEAFGKFKMSKQRGYLIIRNYRSAVLEVMKNERDTMFELSSIEDLLNKIQ